MRCEFIVLFSELQMSEKARSNRYLARSLTVRESSLDEGVGSGICSVDITQKFPPGSFARRRLKSTPFPIGILRTKVEAATSVIAKYCAVVALIRWLARNEDVLRKL